MKIFITLSLKAFFLRNKLLLNVFKIFNTCMVLNILLHKSRQFKSKIVGTLGVPL